MCAFEPEFLGKLNFYLEALDRDVRKPHEQPAIGVLLCASKNDEVVEYAMSRGFVASTDCEVPHATSRQKAAAKQTPWVLSTEQRSRKRRSRKPTIQT